MKVSRLLCLLLPIQDRQLQPAACLNRQNIEMAISRNITKYIEGGVFPDLVLHFIVCCYITEHKNYRNKSEGHEIVRARELCCALISLSFSDMHFKLIIFTSL